jgi:hypothetical protein
MPLEIVCDCTLCHIEGHLLESLTRARGDTSVEPVQFDRLLHSSSDIADLLSPLRASPADASSDELLRKLFSMRASRPEFIESLLILAFVPMMHRTIRRVVRYQPALSEEDVTQQTLSYLLHYLRSDEMRTRRTHFAFAISRAVKRQVFAWAQREGIRDALLDRGIEILVPIEASFERHAQLRHFLHCCVTRGKLTESELDLLIRFKLEGINGDDFDASNGTTSNAFRQKLKRLLSKLRYFAR